MISSFLQENNKLWHHFFKRRPTDYRLKKFVDVLPLSILPAGVWVADLEVFPLAHTEKQR